MSRRLVVPALCVIALSLLSFHRWGATAQTSAVRPHVCQGRSIDSTSPEVKAALTKAQSFRPIGEVKMSSVAGGKVETQDFEALSQAGTTSSVHVTCATSGGCTTGCILTGCSITTIDGQPACTAVQCVNSSGIPCGVQNAVCNKTETTDNSS